VIYFALVCNFGSCISSDLLHEICRPHQWHAC